MVDIPVVAGSKIYIGSASIDLPASGALFVEADFSSVTWQEIGKWETYGADVTTKSDISVDLINEEYQHVADGNKQTANTTFGFSVDTSDVGQIALIAASRAQNKNYPFKIEWADAPVSGTPTKRLWAALVKSAGDEQGGGTNTHQMFNAVLRRNRNIVRIAHS